MGAPSGSGPPPTQKKTYDWDRTDQPAQLATERMKEEQLRQIPFPLATAKSLPLKEFCDYWNTLIENPVAKFARLYVRRWFPALLPEEQEFKIGQIKEAFPSEKILTATDGALSERKILETVGVGDYTIRLNDTRKPFELATVVHCEKFQTVREWNLYPPIFDIKRLDWDNEANRVYIKFAQARGILPRDDERDREQVDMTNSTVVSQLLDQNRSLTEKVINTKEPAPAPKTEPSDGGAMTAMAEVVKAALTRPVPESSDPMKLVQGIAGVVNSLIPKPDTSAADIAKEVVKESAAANERVFKMQEQAINELRAEVRTARAAPAPAPIAPAPPTRQQVFQDVIADFTALQQLAGGRKRIEEEDERPSNIDKWLDVLPLITPVANGFVQGLFGLIQFGLQAWQTNHYNDALARQNGGQPKPPPMTDSKPPEPGQPMAPQGPQPTPQQQAQQQQFQAILVGVSKVIGPLQRALQNSKTGAEFAAMIIEFTEEGRADYDRIRNVAESLTRLGMQVQGQPGIEQFKQAVGYLINMANPAFYQKIATVPTFGTFLEEFYEFDRIMAQEEAMRQSQGSQP